MTAILYQRAVVVPRAVQIALGSRRAVLGTAALFLTVLAFYAMLLPATSTGGAVGLTSLQFLTWGEFALAAVMAALLALTVALGVHGLRRGSMVRSLKDAKDDHHLIDHPIKNEVTLSCDMNENISSKSSTTACVYLISCLCRIYSCHDLIVSKKWHILSQIPLC